MGAFAGHRSSLGLQLASNPRLASASMEGPADFISTVVDTTVLGRHTLVHPLACSGITVDVGRLSVPVLVRNSSGVVVDRSCPSDRRVRSRCHLPWSYRA